MKRRNTWRPWLDPVGLVARLLLAVIALSTAIEVLEATASLREERLSVLGITAVGELDLILGLLMLVSGTLVLAGLWTRAAVIGRGTRFRSVPVPVRIRACLLYTSPSPRDS